MDPQMEVGGIGIEEVRIHSEETTYIYSNMSILCNLQIFAILSIAGFIFAVTSFAIMNMIQL